MVLVQGLTVADFDLNVFLLPVAGKADMGGGLIWRAGMHRTLTSPGGALWFVSAGGGVYKLLNPDILRFETIGLIGLLVLAANAVCGIRLW